MDGELGETRSVSVCGCDVVPHPEEVKLRRDHHKRLDQQRGLKPLADPEADAQDVGHLGKRDGVSKEHTRERQRGTDRGRDRGVDNKDRRGDEQGGPRRRLGRTPLPSFPSGSA